MPNEKPVKLLEQILLAIIDPLCLYGFYRIHQLRKGVIVWLVNLTIYWLISDAIAGLWGVLIGVVSSTSLLIYFMIKWSKEWNRKLESNPQKL